MDFLSFFLSSVTTRIHLMGIVSGNLVLGQREETLDANLFWQPSIVGQNGRSMSYCSGLFKIVDMMMLI